MENWIAIGVDPGKKGGIGVLYSHADPAFWRVDTSDAAKVHDVLGLFVMRSLSAADLRVPVFMAVEFITGASMGKVVKTEKCGNCGHNVEYFAAQQGMLEFGKSVGVILGVAAALEIGLIQVPPAKWQNRYLGLGQARGLPRSKREELYLRKAQERWPKAGLRFKADAGGAAGLFLAQYALDMGSK